MGEEAGYIYSQSSRRAEQSKPGDEERRTDERGVGGGNWYTGSQGGVWEVGGFAERGVEGLLMGGGRGRAH